MAIPNMTVIEIAGYYGVILHAPGTWDMTDHYGLIYAFRPIVTGLPSTSAVVTAFPRVLATARVFPDADGVGFSRSISMQSLLPLISTVIAMGGSPFSEDSDCLVALSIRSQLLAAADVPVEM